MTRLTLLAALLLVLPALAGCGGDDEVAGGSADLPGPVPSGVEFAAAPASAPPAPDFSAELVDGTPVTASELWANRPVVLMFTASFCERCADIHRDVAQAVDEHDGAITLLGVVGDDDTDAQTYAEELDLGYPVAVAGERIWLNYAAREPSLVALVLQGGKVLRGWPNGVDGDELSAQLDELVVHE
ncbi:MAG TPA: redoxin domain-containing protein [Gaiellaceae bacterium]|nr:redoxin domain-containing protein [Gaiellaceae bacterium]